MRERGGGGRTENYNKFDNPSIFPIGYPPIIFYGLNIAKGRESKIYNCSRFLDSSL